MFISAPSWFGPFLVRGINNNLIYYRTGSHLALKFKNVQIHPPCFHLGKDEIDNDAVTIIEAEEPLCQNL